MVIGFQLPEEFLTVIIMIIIIVAANICANSMHILFQGFSTYCAQSRHTLVTLWTVALKAPLPMEVSRQEYWSGVPLLGLLISVASRLVVEQSPQSMRASVVMVQGSVIPQHVGSP